jgi:hypothetical protein
LANLSSATNRQLSDRWNERENNGGADGAIKSGLANQVLMGKIPQKLAAQLCTL